MRHIAAILLVLAPSLAPAQPDQLLRQIELGLREYRIETDVSQLSLAQSTAIYFALNSPDDHRPGDWTRTRQKILAILRRGEAG